MSEVSESLHLWRVAKAQTREIASSAGVLGWIVACNERWSTFVTLEDDEAAKVALEARCLVLHWTYFADEGLLLRFYETGEYLGEIAPTWRASSQPVAPLVASSLSRRLREKGILADVTPLAQWAGEVAVGERSSREFLDSAAALLGLPAYAWLSPRYARDTDLEELRRQFPEAEEVEA